MSTYRFSWLRPGGYTRLGGVGAVAVLFATPMLWALGAFDAGEDTMKRALIFLFAGMWFFVGTGYVFGWAIRGFMVRLKDHEDDDDGPAHRPAGPAHAPPAGAPHRPGH
ncbi:MAG: hypothetical protein H7Z12_14935 [Rhodospirillaceae bacterium]|nr:hypothetical protein [Rhodospirillales bacterium]